MPFFRNYRQSLAEIGTDLLAEFIGIFFYFYKAIYTKELLIYW